MEFKQLMFRVEGAIAKGHYWDEKNSAEAEGIYYGSDREPVDDYYLPAKEQKQFNDEPYPCPTLYKMQNVSCVARTPTGAAALVHYSRARAHTRLMEYYRYLDLNGFCSLDYMTQRPLKPHNKHPEAWGRLIVPYLVAFHAIEYERPRPTWAKSMNWVLPCERNQSSFSKEVQEVADRKNEVAIVPGAQRRV